MTMSASTSGANIDGSQTVAASVRKFQKELSAGIVSLALLGLLANANKPLYGYQIAKDLDDFAEGLPAKQGTSIRCCGRSRPEGC